MPDFETRETWGILVDLSAVESFESSVGWQRNASSFECVRLTPHFRMTEDCSWRGKASDWDELETGDWGLATDSWHRMDTDRRRC